MALAPHALLGRPRLAVVDDEAVERRQRADLRTVAERIARHDGESAVAAEDARTLARLVLAYLRGEQ